MNAQPSTEKDFGAVGDPAEPVPSSLLGPRWWLAWLGLGCLRLIALLPIPVLLVLGAGLGATFGRLARSRRRIVLINLRVCFPDWSKEQIEQTANAHFRALGIGIFEAFIAWWASDEALRKRYEIHGIEHVQAARQAGGILLLTGHFTTMELASRIVNMEACPFHGMYRRADNPFADFWIRRLRQSRTRMPMLPKEDLKRLVRVLRRGGALWYGPDQTIEAPNAVFVPFFGMPTLTLATTARLAHMGHASVVPYFPQRIGGRWRIVFEPAQEIRPEDSDETDARRINALLERAILRCPEQYFWVHRKFKYRPPGAPDVYARDES